MDDTSSGVNVDGEDRKLPATSGPMSGVTNSCFKTDKGDQLLKKTFLSKNELYTPLAGYDQEDVEPSVYLGTKSSIPKSLQESSLVQFYRKVSLDYHYKNPNIPSTNNNNGNDYKNAGASRPIPLADVDDRIRQRTVTLLGGGIHTVATKSSLPSESTSSSLNTSSLFAATNINGSGSLRSRRKRRKRPRTTGSISKEESSSLIKRQASIGTNVKQGRKNDTIQVDNIQLDFVKQLNICWNDYMLRVLQLKPMKQKEDVKGEDYYSTMEIRVCQKLQILSTRHALELVGARLRILSCSQKLTLVGKTGIVVGHSRNCWMIAVLQTPSKKQKGRESSMTDMKPGGVDTSAGSNDTRTCNVGDLHGATNETGKSRVVDPILQNILVPKRGSSIELLLQIPESLASPPSKRVQPTNGTNVDKEADVDPLGNDSSPRSSLVAASLLDDHRTLCVVLNPQID